MAAGDTLVIREATTAVAAVYLARLWYCRIADKVMKARFGCMTLGPFFAAWWQATPMTEIQKRDPMCPSIYAGVSYHDI